MKKFMCLLILILSQGVHAGSLEKTVTSWASSVYLSGKFHLSPEQECIAKNVWFESRGEPRLGKTMVANVVRNRATFGKPFANTICTVVYQKSQFSWTLDARKKNARFNEIMLKNVNKERKSLQEVLQITFEQTLFTPKVVTNATHFTSEMPHFKSVLPVGKVGNHAFFVLKRS